MYKYGEEHPVIFEIILIIASFAVAAVFNIAGYLFNLHPDLSNSAARIITGIVLLVIYKRAYKGNHFFDNLVIVLPALLFPPPSQLRCRYRPLPVQLIIILRSHFSSFFGT